MPERTGGFGRAATGADMASSVLSSFSSAMAWVGLDKTEEELDTAGKKITSSSDAYRLHHSQNHWRQILPVPFSVLSCSEGFPLQNLCWKFPRPAVTVSVPCYSCLWYGNDDRLTVPSVFKPLSHKLHNCKLVHLQEIKNAAFADWRKTVCLGIFT
ncbi:uncharacterized protein [Apostichopus japonicus]|uniref:uncharacterized protein n=1 Tax=Stichopus japonicus TaxID=307972 RepID=UPI003AB7CBF4